MSQSDKLDDELLSEFDFAPSAGPPIESDLGTIFDLELEHFRWEQENGLAEPIESSSDTPESAASIEETYLEDVSQRLTELFSDVPLGEKW